MKKKVVEIVYENNVIVEIEKEHDTKLFIAKLNKPFVKTLLEPNCVLSKMPKFKTRFTGEKLATLNCLLWFKKNIKQPIELFSYRERIT